MNLGLSRVMVILVTALCLTVITSGLARSAIIYESATGAFSPVGGGPGVNDRQFIGASFSVTQQTTIDSIGGFFGQFSSSAGTIFGALVGLNSSGFPSNTQHLLDNVIVSTVFTPITGADYLTPLTATLNAGTYGIVFGSNLFGATGQHLLSLLQTPNVTSTGTVFSSSLSNTDDWSALFPPGGNRVRLLVSAASVPAPAGWPFFVIGLLCLSVISNRHAKNGST